MMMARRSRWTMAALLATLAPALHLVPSGNAEELHRSALPAQEAMERGMGAWNVRLDEGQAAILYDHVLVEDDGPGMGSDVWWLKTDRAPTTELAGSVRVKKVLRIEQPGAREARLCAPKGAVIEINGHPLVALESAEYLSVRVSLLKGGDNEVVLSGRGNRGSPVKMARREDILRNAPERGGRPARSFQSLDGGKTWQPVQGEYLVRLHLVQYVPQGTLISPVVDLGRREGDRSGLLSPVSIRSVSLRADADLPRGTQLTLAFRTGPCPVYEASLWSHWQSPGAAVLPANRYLQWKAVLSSGDPRATPSLRSVAVEARVEPSPPPEWTRSLRIVSSHNEEIRCTSLPFEYEDPLHPRLVALRQKYRLDEVISRARTETEKLVKLRDWVSRQWKYHPPESDYPGWDAEEILRRRTGFCVQYAIVMMQAALSLGHQARFVFGHNPGAFDAGGHEVCEVWSNEHRKWIFLDPHQNWHYMDPRTQVPMSMLELHDLLRKTYYDGRPATVQTAPRHPRPSDALAVCYGTSLLPGTPPEDQKHHWIEGRYTVPSRWLFVNYVPRNNFYAKPYPQPKTQGCEWNWSDYWCWEDAQTPKQWLYRHFTARRSDLEWTLNQVRFDATIGERPGTVLLQLGTFTPYFDTFLVNEDYEGWGPRPRDFAWKLHPGRNLLEMRVRNKAGVEGPVSHLEVDYGPVP